MAHSKVAHQRQPACDVHSCKPCHARVAESVQLLTTCGYTSTTGQLNPDYTVHSRLRAYTSVTPLRDRYVKNIVHSLTGWLKTSPRLAHRITKTFVDNKIHGANMGPIWGRQDPGGPRVGPMNFAMWVHTVLWQVGMLFYESGISLKKLRLFITKCRGGVEGVTGWRQICHYDDPRFWVPLQHIIVFWPNNDMLRNCVFIWEMYVRNVALILQISVMRRKLIGIFIG